MEEIMITDLSSLVLDAMRKRGCKEKSIKEFERYGIRRILAHFSENGWMLYSKETVWNYVCQERSRMESGQLPDYQWRETRRAAVYLEQMAEQGCIQNTPLRSWEAEHNRLFQPVMPGETPSQDIERLVCQVRDAILALDMTEKAKSNYIYCGLGAILKFFDTQNEKSYSQETLEAMIADAQEKYHAGELKRATWQVLRKTALWLKEYKTTGKISHCRLTDASFVPISPNFEKLVQEYDDAIRAEGYLKERTCTVYTAAVRGFLRRMGLLGQQDYGGLTLRNVTACVMKTAEETPLGIFNTMIAMRSFAKFVAEAHPELPDISAALICAPAKRRRVYEGYSNEEATKILSAIERKSVKGKRDFAMIMLAYTTGLRGCDIVCLKFQNIDWAGGEIRLIQKKTDIPLALPLDTATGNAIAEYILNGRPECNSEYIFLRTQHPYTKLSGLGGIIAQYACKALGKTKKVNGPHAFRRSMGRRLLEAGVPAPMICDILGHASADSLRQYTSSSLKCLKQCAGTISFIPVMQEELV